MKASDVARGIALGRVAFGAGLVLAPRAVGRTWVGEHADSLGATVMARGVGVRDLALGVLVLNALPDERRWARALVTASATADAVDFAATLAAGPALPRRTAAMALTVAGGAALAGVLAARRL